MVWGWLTACHSGSARRPAPGCLNVQVFAWWVSGWLCPPAAPSQGSPWARGEIGGRRWSGCGAMKELAS